MMRRREIMTRLQEIAGGLSGDDRQTLLAFAEFLSERAEKRQPMTPAPLPEPMPRHEGETVVAAIKRLSGQYPMLDRSKLLDPTFHLMGEHVLRGRKTAEIIAELEILFGNAHQALLQRDHSDS